VITFTGVGKDYGRGPDVLRDVTFHLARGEFAYLTGPSGAGKSTLLRLIFARERPSRGRVAGQDVGTLGFAPRWPCAAASSSSGFPPHSFGDVFENVVFVLRARPAAAEQKGAPSPSCAWSD
jgi:cell division transport system ATP-binding protein